MVQQPSGMNVYVQCLCYYKTKENDVWKEGIPLPFMGMRVVRYVIDVFFLGGGGIEEGCLVILYGDC
jgi:hypothetical protein